MSTLVSQPNRKGSWELLDPPPTPRPTSLDTGGQQLETSPPCSREDQMRKIIEMVRSRNVKIAVVSNAVGSEHVEEDEARKTSIATELCTVLSGSKALVYEYVIKNKDNWLAYLKSVQVTYYIFIELPPFDPYHATTPESEFFHPRSQRITEVVMVRKRRWAGATTPGGTRITSYTPVQHYLEKFQHLEGTAKDIAAKALCHFAASQPIPHLTDKVFWSLLPKVHHIQKNHNSLGLSIMTREMAPKSHFPRIVLVKSLAEDCIPSLRDCVGKYTHIQSFNGILLDGLSITDVTSIIQSCSAQPHIQLVVRYVHPIKTATHSAGLVDSNFSGTGTPTSPAPSKHPADRIDPLHETLPIPLMILGDIHSHCRELFSYLSGSDKEMVRHLNLTDNDVDSQVSNHTSGSNAQDTVVVAATTTTTSHPTSLLVPSSRHTKSEASASSYDSHDGSDVVHTDSYVRRLPVSRTLFSNSNLSSPSTTPIRTGQLHPPYNRQNTYPFIDKSYVLSMFTQEMDRKFIHLYLRESGIYLVVVGLEDLVEDPVIQFENLLFWLRLVQTYVKPNGIKRVMIVGMSNGPSTSEGEQECLSNLEGAIKEAQFQHIFNRDGSFVVTFNRSRPKASVNLLCRCISKCMDTIITRAWHMNRQFFESVFLPFTGLAEVLGVLSHSKQAVMSADSILSVYNFADLNYFDTLAAYSHALISDRLDSLLKPSFLIDLLKKLSLNSDTYKDSFLHDIPSLKHLPVVLHPWPKAQIEAMDLSFTRQQVTSIMKWAERYELFYSLGYSANFEVYFIPLLATEFLAENACYDWPYSDDDEDCWFNDPNVTTLYIKLNFSSIDNFFHLVLAEILKDVLNGIQDPNQKYFIKFGCTEAVMPIQVPEANANITVYMKYHLLQNVIEFRTVSKTKQLYLYQAADSKLSSAFSHSNYKGTDWTRTYKSTVTFHIPSNQHDPEFVSSSMGKLCGVGSSREGYVRSEDYGEHDQLLQMKQVTDKEWLSAYQDMKTKIPPEQFMQWGRRLSTDTDKWALVAAKLKLMTRDDVDFFCTNPKTYGNGRLVLSKWIQSKLTYKDLTESLRSEEVRLDTLADEIEVFFGTDV